MAPDEPGCARAVRPETADRAIADEVENDLEESTRAWMERGLSAKEARRAAKLEMGSTTAVREQVREYGWENSIDTTD